MLSSWAVDREIFLTEAEKLRARFDAERGCSTAKAARLLKVRGNNTFVKLQVLYVIFITLYEKL